MCVDEKLTVRGRLFLKTRSLPVIKLCLKTKRELSVYIFLVCKHFEGQRRVNDQSKKYFFQTVEISHSVPLFQKFTDP